MRRCFVMQPFDGGSFDNRFDDVLAPAIKAADLEPYRVDRDANAAIPIDTIENEIRNSDVCLAEITTDNPNVWFELGYAIACGKEVVLICAAARTSRFPFDIQHRAIITYKTESPRDFDELRDRITARLKAAGRKAATVASLSSSALPTTQGLAPHEIAALVVIMESSIDPESPLSGYGVRQNMANAGFTDLAASLAVKRLLRQGLIDMTQAGDREQYTGFVLTERGESWLIENQERFSLRRESNRKGSTASDFEEFGEDLPF